MHIIKIRGGEYKPHIILDQDQQYQRYKRHKIVTSEQRLLFESTMKKIINGQDRSRGIGKVLKALNHLSDNLIRVARSKKVSDLTYLIELVTIYVTMYQDLKTQKIIHDYIQEKIQAQQYTTLPIFAEGFPIQPRRNNHNLF
jgi:hypothetical protein